MELKHVIDKSLAIAPIMVPRHVLKSLEQKMNDYLQSMTGEGPSPVPTRDVPSAKPVRQCWRIVQKKWSQIAKDLTAKDGVTLVRLKTFLESEALQDFENVWNEFDPDTPKTIVRSADELKQVQDFESEEALRLKRAGDVEHAKNVIAEIKLRLKADHDELMTSATDERRKEHDLIVADIQAALKPKAEDWIKARECYERLAQLMDKVLEKREFDAQRAENRDNFAARLSKLGDAISHLAPGNALDKEALAKLKQPMLERMDKLSRLFDTMKLDVTWEPTKPDLAELLDLWSGVYRCRNETGVASAPEPGIKVVHGDAITKDANRWRAWAAKIADIDAAFTTRLLEFSSTMKLTGNPGCRFHRQGKYWKFYLDEAEMGGSTTIRGLYLPTKLEDGSFVVSFEAITDSHGGPAERVLYGSRD